MDKKEEDLDALKILAATSLNSLVAFVKIRALHILV